MKTEKDKIQNMQFNFPYHHIPYFCKDGGVKLYRAYKNGFEYLCYLIYAKGIIEGLRPKSFLEVGCGDGRLIGMINNIPEKVGVDISEKAIRFAKAFFPEIDFHVMNASKLKRTFDVVAAVEVLEHIPEEKINEFFCVLHQLTKKGGHIVITVPTQVKALVKKHYRHYNFDMINDHVSTSKLRLEIKKVDYVYRKSSIVDIYTKLSNNRFWFFEITYINKILWKYVWKKLRDTDHRNGLHMVITLVRI